ncbi:hypothetical protein WBJ53_21925 [Spirosoma sp. SC4-14]|uniref:hypothetical protein n=1 Tax=Spirosoma sp. SC4-14 TaxID=3128900 RepID=UPI0030CADAC3
MKRFLLASFLLLCNIATAQRFSHNEITINAFRNPSIGLEYRRNHVSVHAGYYITALTAGVTTKFAKTGVTYWFLAVNRRENPSSFYASASYLRGLNLEYKDQNAFSAEVGFRWMVWQGLNIRLGVLALAAEGKEVRINPTPGISYSFHW